MKIGIKAIAGSCLVKFTEKYEANTLTDIFGHTIFSHKCRRRGDE